MELGRYQLGEPLGSGGMGAVLGATRRGDGASLAIKLLSGLRAQSAAARADFAHEIWSLARLDHPGIVGVIDWGVVDEDEGRHGMLPGTPYLVMERAESHLSRSRFPTCWAELLPLVQDILSALAHAHARNVVHRDLKPGNVLHGMGRWKLADFGIAHALDRHQVDGSWTRTVGTPRYMAPEQITGDWRDFGPWTDLYAVGVLVYELVTGHTPFPTLTGSDLMRAVVERAAPAPSDTRFPVPVDFESWLGRLLERSFLDRAQRAADVSLWLEQLGGPRSTDSALPLADRADLTGTTLTMPLDGLDKGPIALRALPSGASGRLPRRPVPPDWRPLELRSEAPASDSGALPRAIPFTGREAERDRVWSALRAVDRGEGARAVVLRGASESGKTALGRWTLERAHELGAAWQLVCTCADPPGPLDGVGPMFATFLRSVDLPRAELVERMHTLLQLREGGGGLEHVVAELMAPAPPEEDVPVRFGSVQERNAAALGALQVLTGALGGEGDTAPRRCAVILVDDVDRDPEALGLVHLALAHRDGLPTPLLFLLTVSDPPAQEAELDALEALDGVERLDLDPLPQALRTRLAQAAPPIGVEALRTGVGPPVHVEADALETAIHTAITGTTGGSTTTDGL